MTTTHIGQRIEQVRRTYGLTQKAFGARLAVTSSYISSLESGRKTPSKIILKLICYEFSVNAEWLESGKGDPFAVPGQNERFRQGQIEPPRKSSKVKGAHLLVTAAIHGPIMPAVAAGLAIGVGASEIIDKMQKAYGARNVKDLADNHLNIDRTSMAHWVSKNNVPRKYLEKAVADTGHPLEFFFLQEEAIEAGHSLVVEFTREQILEVLEELRVLDALHGHEDLSSIEIIKAKLKSKLEKLELSGNWEVRRKA